MRNRSLYMWPHIELSRESAERLRNANVLAITLAELILGILYARIWKWETLEWLEYYIEAVTESFDNGDLGETTQEQIDRAAYDSLYLLNEINDVYDSLFEDICGRETCRIAQGAISNMVVEEKRDGIHIEIQYEEAVEELPNPSDIFAFGDTDGLDYFRSRENLRKRFSNNRDRYLESIRKTQHRSAIFRSSRYSSV